jgi:putative holliday junction resolvase
MGRILAIDYGRKRCGLAVTDSLQLIAGGLNTIATHELVSFLEAYFTKENVGQVVIGLPKQMNNEPSESMKYIEPFVRTFKKKWPEMPITYYDERFTSKLAHQAMRMGGLKKTDRQDKALVDEISAVIILQSYMESKR